MLNSHEAPAKAAKGTAGGIAGRFSTPYFVLSEASLVAAAAASEFAAGMAATPPAGSGSAGFDMAGQSDRLTPCPGLKQLLQSVHRRRPSAHGGFAGVQQRLRCSLPDRSGRIPGR